MNRRCNYCGFVGAARADARYCPRCGGEWMHEKSDAALVGERVIKGGAVMRSTGVAYLLWALCLVGLAGIHRFYARKYITGVIWLLTWGLLGIGLIIDLFLIDGMVERANRRTARSHFAF